MISAALAVNKQSAFSEVFVEKQRLRAFGGKSLSLTVNEQSGKRASDEVIAAVFERFCVGK